MIIDTKTTEVEGTLSYKESVKMTIDANASALIIRHLTNLYSNPYVAALREYTSNAFDSHKVAGTTRPVEVVLPNSLMSNLIIQDFGVGLDREGLRSYGQYGLSSKNGSNDEVGGFGLGSKSGLAIASQFTVTAVKDGLKNTAIIAFDESGAPVMNFVNAEPKPTDEVNGVRISIPTTETYKLTEALESGFLMGWVPGSILVNGEEHTGSVHDVATYSYVNEAGWVKNKMGEGYYPWHARGTALVGPVKYTIDWDQAYPELDAELRRTFFADVVMELPIGSVDLTPSREDLIYSARTRAALRVVADKLIEHGKSLFQERIDAAENIREALLRKERAAAQGFTHDYTYNGVSLHPVAMTEDQKQDAHISAVRISEEYNGNGYTFVRDWAYHSLINAERVLQLALHSNDHAVLVYNAGETKTITSRARFNPDTWTQHTLNRALPNYFRGLQEDGESISQYTRYYMTTLSQEEIDPVIFGAFPRTLDGADIAERAEQYKKDHEKELREARAEARKNRTVDDTPIRTIMYRSNGRSVVSDTTLGRMDASEIYIYLPNATEEEDKVVYELRRTMLTRKGAEENRALNVLLDNVAQSGKYRFITSMRSWKDAEYFKKLTIVTFADVVDDMADVHLKKFSKVQLRAALDKKDNRASWVYGIDSHAASQINRDETREWIAAVKDAPEAEFNFLQRVALNAEFLGLDPKKYKIEADASTATPASRYPLLDAISSYSLGMSKSMAAVEYINLLDASLEAAEAAEAEVEDEAA